MSDFNPFIIAAHQPLMYADTMKAFYLTTSRDLYKEDEEFMLKMMKPNSGDCSIV